MEEIYALKQMRKNNKKKPKKYEWDCHYFQVFLSHFSHVSIFSISDIEPNLTRYYTAYDLLNAWLRFIHELNE